MEEVRTQRSLINCYATGLLTSHSDLSPSYMHDNEVRASRIVCNLKLYAQGRMYMVRSWDQIGKPIHRVQRLSCGPQIQSSPP